MTGQIICLLEVSSRYVESVIISSMIMDPGLHRKDPRDALRRGQTQPGTLEAQVSIDNFGLKLFLIFPYCSDEYRSVSGGCQDRV